MYALKMLGLAVLAGACTFAFIIGYNQFQELSASTKARDEASKLNDSIKYVISTGNSDKVNIKIPGGYTLVFESKKIKINGFEYPKPPQDNYNLPLDAEPSSLSQNHYLEISLENEKVKIREVQ